MNMIEARRRATEKADLHAFISLSSETTGHPVAVKDILDVEGLVTTAGAECSSDPARADALAVTNMRRHGFGVVGKTNLHQWACGVTGDNRTYGRIVNPDYPGRIAGGSSGGSAAAVRAGLCDWAIGTDTGGSIRIPAAFCGVFGLKPTTGAIPTDGVIPVSPTLDTIGPLARDLRTLASAWMALEGGGADRPFCIERQSRPRVAIPSNWPMQLDDTTRYVWEVVRDGLESIDLPDLKEMLWVQQTIVRREAAEKHGAKLAEEPERYADDVRDFILSGLAIPDSAYAIAIHLQGILGDTLEHALRDYDALLTPTTPVVAPSIGDVDTDIMAIVNTFTRPINVAGQPAVSIPIDHHGIPVGLQLVGHRASDLELLEAADSFVASLPLLECIAPVEL